MEEVSLMRIDKYLKVSRLIKRRTIANQACEQDRILINGRVAKPSSDVKIGDIIEVQFGTKMLKIEVTNVSEHPTKEMAETMYKEIEYK
jgi:ribosomal 50S subunit-recycling heat shock protein